MPPTDKLDLRLDRFDAQLKNIETQMNARFDAVNERFSDVVKLLFQLQSDLRQFYFQLGQHEARLDNLEREN